MVLHTESVEYCLGIRERVCPGTSLERRQRLTQNRPTFNVPVRWPRRSFINGPGEAAGPPENSAELPTANNCIDHAVGIGCPTMAASRRQFINPVGINLVRRIEIGSPAQLIRLPGVDDLRL